MIDYQELMKILSIPRPNGSHAVRQTSHALQGWLKDRGIPYQVQSIRIYPYFFECIGIWLILSRTLLALSVWARWGWWTAPIAILGLLGGTLDTALNWPLVTWPGIQRSENILIEFNPPTARQELLFCAHYDTKTELLDHAQRMFLFQRMNFGILLTILMGVWGPLQMIFTGTALETTFYWLGVGFSIVMLLFAWALGLHLSLGRLLEPSPGAVDNGTSCAILLGLADQIAKDKGYLGNTKVTLALFTAEEVKMQGSRAYVHSRDWSLPAAAVNLEVMAQDGEYVYWEKDGNVFRLLPTDEMLNKAFSTAVAQVTAENARPEPLVNSDGASFLFAGIPATTVGTLDSELGDTGFHRPTDNLDRVALDRLSEGVEILQKFLSLVKVHD